MTDVLIGPPQSGLTAQAAIRAIASKSILVVAKIDQVRDLIQMHQGRLAVIDYHEFHHRYCRGIKRQNQYFSGYVIDDLVAFAQFIIAGDVEVHAVTIPQQVNAKRSGGHRILDQRASRDSDPIRHQFIKELQHYFGLLKPEARQDEFGFVHQYADSHRDQIFKLRARLFNHDRTYYPDSVFIDPIILKRLKEYGVRFDREDQGGMIFRYESDDTALVIAYVGGMEWRVSDGRISKQQCYFVGYLPDLEALFMILYRCRNNLNRFS